MQKMENAHKIMTKSACFFTNLSQEQGKIKNENLCKTLYMYLLFIVYHVLR